MTPSAKERSKNYKDYIESIWIKYVSINFYSSDADFRGRDQSIYDYPKNILSNRVQEHIILNNVILGISACLSELIRLIPVKAK